MKKLLLTLGILFSVSGLVAAEAYDTNKIYMLDEDEGVAYLFDVKPEYKDGFTMEQLFNDKGVHITNRHRKGMITVNGDGFQHRYKFDQMIFIDLDDNPCEKYPLDFTTDDLELQRWGFDQNLNDDEGVN